MTIGTLFHEGFLAEGIQQSARWQELNHADISALRSTIFSNVANPKSQNEAQTQHHIIKPDLAALGWSGALSRATTS